jgi:hypothetical protein
MQIKRQMPAISEKPGTGRIFDKLNVSSRTEAAVQAAKIGLVSLR